MKNSTSGTPHAAQESFDAYEAEMDAMMNVDIRPAAEAFGMAASELEEMSFCIQAVLMPKLKALAVENSVSILIEDDETTAEFFVKDLMNAAAPYGYRDDEARAHGRAAQLPRARQMAVTWKRVTVSYPKSERYETLGMAKRVGDTDAAATFYMFPKGEHYWTPSAVKNFTFSRCDHCGTRRNRDTIYIVVDTVGGRTLQLGGTCAANLDLGHKLKAAVRGICNLLKAADGDGLIMGSRWARTVLPRHDTLSLIDGWIRQHGYISGKKAYGDDLISTKDSVGAMISGFPASSVRAAEVIRTAYATDAGRTRIADLEPWMEAVVTRVEARNYARSEENPDGVKFAANLRSAFDFPNTRTLGYLAYLVSAALADSAKAGAPQVTGNWPSEEGLEVNNGAQLATMLARGQWTPETFAEAVSLDVNKLNKALAKPDKLLPKYLLVKASKHPQGLWYVASVREFHGDYGPTWKMGLVRLDDGAQITASGGGNPPYDAEVVVRFGTVFIKSDDMRNEWVRKYGPQVNRVHLERVDVELGGGIVEGPSLRF